MPLVPLPFALLCRNLNTFCCAFDYLFGFRMPLISGLPLPLPCLLPCLYLHTFCSDFDYRFAFRHALPLAQL
jgi:hypothetical protein